MVDHINAFLQTAQTQAVNSPTSGFQDCNINHPAEIFCFLRSDMPVLRILLTCFSRPFRATCTEAAYGGAVASASGSPHHHVCNYPAHEHSIDMHTWHHSHSTTVQASTAGQPVYLNGSDLGTSVGGSIPTTQVDWVGQNATAESGGGGSTTSDSDILHTHQIPSHVHDLVFGIFEFPYFAGVELRMNNKLGPRCPTFGRQGNENNYFDCTLLDITSSLHAPNGLEEGVNMLYITPVSSTNNPLGLIRIFSELTVQYKS